MRIGILKSDQAPGPLLQAAGVSTRSTRGSGSGHPPLAPLISGDHSPTFRPRPNVDIASVDGPIRTHGRGDVSRTLLVPVPARPGKTDAFPHIGREMATFYKKERA